MTKDEAIAWINEPGITPEERRNRKTITFSIIYGMGEQRLARLSGGVKVEIGVDDAFMESMKRAAKVTADLSERIRKASENLAEQFLRGTGTTNNLKGLWDTEPDDKTESNFKHHGTRSGKVSGRIDWMNLPRMEWNPDYWENFINDRTDFASSEVVNDPIEPSPDPLWKYKDHLHDAWRILFEDVDGFFTDHTHKPEEPKLTILSYPPDKTIKEAKDFTMLRRINEAIKLMKTHIL